ncbi:MAG: hypothetical protein B6D73_05715 [gamma proteobacterium symbiont of Stewartia floridana]|nr:MAG: hypothetical protein B6D73_05715 [gamma proteobacterium symbiont of Stewartia floridana]
MVKMLRGVSLPSVDAMGVTLKWQTEALGWKQIDDLLIICEGAEKKQLAISCKSNMQVRGSGLPLDFVKNAWALWQEGKPLNKEYDCMMLVQKGNNQNFFTAWADLKLWCSESDIETVVARITNSQKHSNVYNSVKNPECNSNYTDEDSIALIRNLEVIPSDFHLATSEYETTSLAHCRDILHDGSEENAKKLWDWLLKKAKEKRVSGGTLQLSELWQELVPVFNLKDHPNYAASWTSLETISEEYKSTIETSLPNGHSLKRSTEEHLLERLKDDQICVVYGSSGSGKSAFVKSTLDNKLPQWKQVWLSPENLDLALSETTRSDVGLLKPLKDILVHTSEEKKILIIDSAERISPDCIKKIKSLISNILATNSDQEGCFEWRVIIVGQTEAWGSGDFHEIAGRTSIQPIEISSLDPADVRAALHSSGHLSWLASDNEALIALGNLKTLAWVMRAESVFSEGGIDDISLPAIADRLWSYWTSDKIKFHNLLTQLAEREAEFQRSFPISGFDIDVSEALDEGLECLPLRKRKDINSIEFEHDLGADWARFQRLKEIKNDISSWAPYASNPLWHNALRMMGQQLLREKNAEGTLWDVAYEEAEKTKDENPLAADILLDSLCLDPFAAHYLNERSEMLFADKGARLNRLLRRFHHIATVSNVSKESLEIDPSLKLYLEDMQRLPIYGRWPQVAKFLSDHKEQVAKLISPMVSKLCETWLTTTPLYLDREKNTPMPYRKEFAELALETVRALQLEQMKGHFWLRDDSEKPLYGAAFAAANDLPEEVCEWALEMVYRRPCKKEITEALQVYREEKRKEHADKMRNDKDYREKKERLRAMPTSISSYRDLPPWPLGPQGRVDNAFRDYCLSAGSLTRLMYLRPEVASEFLLALLIDDSPTEDYSSSPLRDYLGLEFSNSGYPTAYWKSPFFQFFQLNTTVAVDTLITLVNFCTDRWADNYKGASSLEFTVQDGKKNSFMGDGWVFSWSQENCRSNGQLHCALAALEKWICTRIDQKEDVEPVISTLLRNSNSVAIIGVLLDVGKYKPDLFTNVLQPLLGVYELYRGDDNRVQNADRWFDAFAWVREGEKVLEMAKEWKFAPYRKTPLRQLAVQFALNDEKTANYIKKVSKAWEMSSGDEKYDLEVRILKAELDPENYKPEKDQQSGQTFLRCHYPDKLQQDIEGFQKKNNPRLQAVTLPYQCEKILASPRKLTDEEAEKLADALNVVSIEEDEESILATEAAIASALIVKASSWLDKNPEIKNKTDKIIQNIISNIGDTSDSLMAPGRFMSDRSLVFATHVVVENFINGLSPDKDTDAPVLRVLTSGDNQAVFILMNAAYKNREKLGNRWWRLIQISIFWAALNSLSPSFREGEDKSIEIRWARWLRWLRTRDLNVSANAETIDPIGVAARVDRLKETRIKRLFGKDAEGRLRYHHRVFSGLETYTLDKIFSWLLSDQGHEIDDSQDVRFLTQKLWEFEAWRKQKCEEANDDDNDRDSLPSDLGYSLLRKLSKLLVTATKDEAANIWKPIFSLGVNGHHAIEHLIDGWFIEVAQSKNMNSLSLSWREMIEFALSLQNWSPNRYWYEGEKLFRHLLGFSSINFLESEGAQETVLEIKDLYERWAKAHLSQEEDNVAAFARFLSSKVGASIRYDGLLWIRDSLLPPDALNWRREETGSALIELLDIIVSNNKSTISSDSSFREALLAVAAHLVARQVPVALSLQESIRKAR